MSAYLGIEIGGTKLQIGVGADEDGSLIHLWRGTVDPSAGGARIRERILQAVPEVLQQSGLPSGRLIGAGIGFGGPVDYASQTAITSHQIDGWDNFPLISWMQEKLGLRAVMANDADVAGLGEAILGTGKGLSPIFYVTIGSGIGGALIVDGQIYRGIGRGAAELGHLRMHDGVILEHLASGWAIARRAREEAERRPNEAKILLQLAQNDFEHVDAPLVAQAARRNDPIAKEVLESAWSALADGLCNVIALLCPRRIVIGGGVSLLGDQLFEPLRRMVAEREFRPFADCYDIVPAALGEEVVIHGALTLALRHFGNRE